MQRAGNRTECALLELSARLHPQGWQAQQAVLAAQPILHRVNFSSRRKRSLAVVLRPQRPQHGNSTHSSGAGSSGASSGASSTHSSNDSSAASSSNSGKALLPCRVYSKGAAELLIARCSRMLMPDGSIQPLDAACTMQGLLQGSPLTRGLRMLAFTYR